ncbi:MAG: sigma-70 family RNA polymerase sigma factor [Planctomycetaceae bacterium]|nr:sigma-70 family RNA polymerase sigma factor [Planctomycetaceae bacterium]
MADSNVLADSKLTDTIEQLCEKAQREWASNVNSAAGDLAFEEIYSQWMPRAVRLVEILLVFSALRQESEFIANGAMMRIYQALRKGQFDARRDFSPWANQVVRNVVTDSIRPLSHDVSLTTNIDFRQLSERACPEVLDRTHLEQRVEAMLNILPLPEADLLTRHYLKGQTIEEMEQETGMTDGAIRGLLHRARKRIQATFSGPETSDRESQT